MWAMASQINVSIFYSTFCSGTGQRKHQSSASLAFVRGIHRWPVYSPRKGPVTRKNASIWWRHHASQLSLIVMSLPTCTFFLLKHFINYHFCEARRASHCHSPQTTFSSNSTCCVLSAQKSAMHVVVYADRLTTQHSIVDIVHWSWSYWQFCYPRWHVECFWAALAAHWISSASHTSVLPQHPRRKIVPYRVGWNHHTSDYYG